MTGHAPCFIGRDRELTEVTTVFDQADDGRGRLVLVVGEPGIGKTALAEWTADAARERGFRAAWGSARGSEGAPSFWPWMQLLQSEELHDLPFAGSLLMDLRGEGAASAPPQAADAAEARFRVFDTAVGAFRQAATEAPILLVLDDLHWADEPSLRLLAFLEPRLRDTRVVVVATTREQDMLPLSGGFSADALQIPLSGLDRPETADLAAATAGARLRPAVAHAIHERTAGNPLFVQQLTRLLAGQDRLDVSGLTAVPHAIPTTIRSVFERRLSRLPPDCRDLLARAAVLGVRFTTDALEGMARDTPGEIDHLLEHARAAEIVAQIGDRDWSFTHALLRETLYSELPPGTRRRLHGTAAASIADSSGGSGTPAQIAHHLRRSGTDVIEAASYTQRAAEAATRQLAYEEAVRHYEEAVDLLEFKVEEQWLRCDLLLGLGEAQMRSGDTDAARATFLLAAADARALGDADRLGRSALGYGALVQFAGFAGADETLVRLIEDALDALPPDPDPLRMQLLFRLTNEVYYTDRDRFSAIAEEVAALGPRLDDPASRARALFVHHATLMGGPEAARRRELADEMVGLAEASGDLELALTARAHRVVHALQLGDVVAVEAEAASIDRRARDLRFPSWLWFPALWRATLALLEGRIQRAEDIAQEALELGQPRGQQAADHYGIQLLFIRREQDRFDELEPLIRGAINQYPYLPSYRCVLALLEAESGRHAAAKAELHRLAADAFAAVPADFTFMISGALLAETCALLREAGPAAALIERLKPYEDLYVTVGFAGLCYGSMARFLALLEDARGRFAEAERLFEAAVEKNRRLGSVPAVARTQYEHARMLLRRGGRGDGERARSLLAQAAEVAGDLALVELGRKIRELDTQPGPVPNVFRKDGDVWTVGFVGRAVVLKDSKGLRDLSVLLVRQGTEVHVLDLVAAQERADVRVATRGDAMLDEEARAAYRVRVEELREQIEEAERFGDVMRGERGREELEVLSRELSAAYGLGGRVRRTGDTVERARKAVSARVRDAIRRIGEVHPDLGRHLDRSVQTGVFCSYAPDEPVFWTF